MNYNHNTGEVESDEFVQGFMKEWVEAGHLLVLSQDKPWVPGDLIYAYGLPFRILRAATIEEFHANCPDDHPNSKQCAHWFHAVVEVAD